MGSGMTRPSSMNAGKNRVDHYVSMLESCSRPGAVRCDMACAYRHNVAVAIDSPQDPDHAEIEYVSFLYLRAAAGSDSVFITAACSICISRWTPTSSLSAGT